MNVVPNTRWRDRRTGSPAPLNASALSPVEGYEPAGTATERMLLLKLSKLRHHVAEAKRIEAEIAPLARAFADARGEYLRPTPAQLHQRLGLK